MCGRECVNWELLVAEKFSFFLKDWQLIRMTIKFKRVKFICQSCEGMLLQSSQRNVNSDKGHSAYPLWVRL